MGARELDVKIVAGNPTNEELAAVVVVMGALLAGRAAPQPAPPRHRVPRGRVTCTAVRRRLPAPAWL